MRIHDEIGGEKDKQYYLKERQKISRFISGRKSLILLVILFLPLLFLVAKYKHSLPVESNIVSSSTIEADRSNKKDEVETVEEREKKLEIVTQVFGNHIINFAGQVLKLSHFSNQDGDALVTYYSSDILDYSAENQVVIYQYGNKMAVSNLLEKELLDEVQYGYDSQLMRIVKRDDVYFIAYSDHDDDYTYANLNLVKIFEKDGGTYKIQYEKEVHKDALEKSHSWVDKEYLELIDYFKDVDLSYSQEVLNDSLKIKNDLSKNNLYNNVKWETKAIKENNAYANINLEYPEFKGFASANKLNKIINNLLLGTLEADRKSMEDWKKDEKNSYTDDEGNVISDCYGDQDYFYSCSVNLHSSFKVKSIINDVISIEIILTDYTGGGNGNHSYPKTIIYDLKNGKQLFIDDIFCGNDYLKKVKEVLRANLINGSVFDNSLGYLTDEVLLSYLRETSFNDFGLTLSFSPYIFTPGAYGIYDIFIPYTVLENNLCFKDSGNNEIFIKRNLLNLEVPAKLSDSCGFMANDCEAFSFYQGKFNEINSHDFDREKPYISVLFNDYKTGTLLNNSKVEQVVMAPYYWQATSGGSGLYVLKIENNNLVLLSRIDVGKGLPENIKIENNKIYFSYINLDDSEISRKCYFKDNKIEEKNLICE